MKHFVDFIDHHCQERQSLNLEVKIRELGDPKNVRNTIRSLGVQRFDDLITRLESSPAKKLIVNYLSDKNGGEHLESLSKILRRSMNMATKTIGEMLGGFTTNPQSIERLNYAGMLFLCYSLSEKLTSEELKWFGRVIIEPNLFYSTN